MSKTRIRSHWHITLADCTPEKLKKASDLVGAKATQIDLEKPSGTVADMMVTGYQMGTDPQNVLRIAEDLKAAGFDPVRVKLEANLSDILITRTPIDWENQYVEVHFHVPEHMRILPNPYLPFVFSSNPTSNGERFANFRAYNYEETAFIIAYTSGFRNVHLELCVFDTKKHHDQDWWDMDGELL